MNQMPALGTKGSKIFSICVKVDVRLRSASTVLFGTCTSLNAAITCSIPSLKPANKEENIIELSILSTPFGIYVDVLYSRSPFGITNVIHFYMNSLILNAMALYRE
jgi:hypothetical protein